jgi:organic hydroperoxide reductase OsmC/OhrA
MTTATQEARPRSGTVLFVIPCAQRDGFEASIRGHLLDLVSPRCGNELAPTPDDLLVASHASELAWSAREFLRTRGLPDSVSVTAAWHMPANGGSTAQLHLTVTVAGRAADSHLALGAHLEDRLAARAVAEQVVHLAFEPSPDDVEPR